MDAGVQQQLAYADRKEFAKTARNGPLQTPSEALTTLFSFCAQVVFYHDEYDALNERDADYEDYEEAWDRLSTAVDDIRDWLAAHGLERRP
jgi:hypothetical protein